MNFKKLAENRYSTKKYDSTKEISDDVIQELKEILVLCPSSVNCQPWKFTFISNKKIKSKLSKVSFHNESKIQEASHIVVFSVIDDLKLLNYHINNTLNEEKSELFKKHTAALNENEIKTWLSHQVYISLGYFLSACASMNIDSTAMEGIESDQYANILGLDDFKPLFAVCLGYHHKDDYNHPSKNAKSRLPLDEVIDTIL